MLQLFIMLMLNSFITASSRGAVENVQPRPVWSKANFAAISEEINAHDWVTEFNDLLSTNSCFELFLERYKTACNKHIPTTTAAKSVINSPLATPLVLKAIDEKRTSWWRYITASTKNKATMIEAYRKAQKHALKVCKAAKLQHEENIV